jgi:hypothetical protein
LRRIHHRGRIFPSTPRSKKGPNGLPVTVNETEPDRAKAESWAAFDKQEILVAGSSRAPIPVESKSQNIIVR